MSAAGAQRKGPAEVAASPSHGPEPLREVKNMQSNSTAMLANAKASFAPVERANSLRELRDLIEMAEAITDDLNTGVPITIDDLCHIQTLLSIACRRVKIEVEHMEAFYASASTSRREA